MHSVLKFALNFPEMAKIYHEKSYFGIHKNVITIWHLNMGNYSVGLLYLGSCLCMYHTQLPLMPRKMCVEVEHGWLLSEFLAY